MSDYTPTTEEVRTFYAYGCGPEHTWDESLTDFDHWLARYRESVIDEVEDHLVRRDQSLLSTLDVIDELREKK